MGRAPVLRQQFTAWGSAAEFVFDLARRDFEHQYRGTALGFLWSFLQPLLFVLVLFLVFAVGLRTKADVGAPFSLYLLSGFICWHYFSTNLSSLAGVLSAHGFLVKKVVVPVELLPLVKLLSSALSHVVLILFAVFVCWWNGYAPGPHTLLLLYYCPAMLLLLLGLGWLFSASSLFLRDVNKFVAISVQFGFWLTPIFWPIELVPAAYRWIVKLNPVYYLVTGYRHALLGEAVADNDPLAPLVFWVVCLFSVVVGYRVFRRLRPHFAEVL